jgi:hypothetical protein
MKLMTQLCHVFGVFSSVLVCDCWHVSVGKCLLYVVLLLLLLLLLYSSSLCCHQKQVIVALMIVTALVMVASENWTSAVQTVIEHSNNVL